MDTPFLPAERKPHHVWAGFSLEMFVDEGHVEKFRVTCSCCSSNSVDVDLGEAGGVVVDDDLHSRNIQTPASEQEGRENKVISVKLQPSVLICQLETWKNLQMILWKTN